MPRASQFDPYRTFKFKVRFGDTPGTAVAGVMKVSALSRTVAANELKQGGDLTGPLQNPGAVHYDDVVLERGLSADAIFESWANAVVQLLSDPSSVSNFKRTVYIDVYDLAGNPGDTTSLPITTYKLNRAWVTKYTALPELDAGAGNFGIQSLTLRHEGWERVA